MFTRELSTSFVRRLVDSPIRLTLYVSIRFLSYSSIHFLFGERERERAEKSIEFVRPRRLHYRLNSVVVALFIFSPFHFDTEVYRARLLGYTS